MSHATLPSVWMRRGSALLLSLLLVLLAGSRSPSLVLGFSANVLQSSSWEARLKQLKAFRAEHGHLNVPSTYQKHNNLGAFVAHQLHLHKKHMAGKKTSLTKERIKQLEDIGFLWTSRKEVSWEKRMEQLRAFRAEHGHLDVPQAYHQRNNLGVFVGNQRRFYKNYMTGKKTPLTEERIKQLEDAGFAWTGHNGVLWEKRIKQLRSFRAEHGHLDVPTVYQKHDNLVTFLVRQRKLYKQYMAGKKTSLTKERIKQLEDIGFLFTSRKGVSWEKRMEQLRAFRAEHGHLDVPKVYQKHNNLGTFVNKQRTLYKQTMSGKKTPLTVERIKQLEGLGIAWTNRVPWEKRIEQLRSFRAEHGHLDVPAVYHNHNNLGTFVVNQSQFYKKHLAGN